MSDHRVIATVRGPAELHERIKREVARINYADPALGVTINSFCIAAIEAAIDEQETVFGVRENFEANVEHRTSNAE